MKSKCSLGTMVSRNLEHNPEKVALIEGERLYTFGELGERVHRMGNGLLGLGLGKSDRVAILSRNSIENAESYFSVPNAGLVLVMLNFRLAPSEILTILADAHVSALMVSDEYVGHVEQIKDRLRFLTHYIFIGDKARAPEGWLHYETLMEQSSSRKPPVEVAEDDLAALMYTSGTTGAPKGCMVTHRNLYHVGQSMAHEMRMDEDDLGIIPAPLFHASGAVVLMNCVYSGCASIIMPRWDVEEFARLVEAHKVTMGLLATPMLLYFVAHPKTDQYDLRSLRKIVFAGAPVTPVVFQRAIERFGNIFLHGFGTTETVGSVCILKLEEAAEALAEGRTEILGSCGKSYAGMEAQVVDENGTRTPPGAIGEIRARGLGITMGYWNKEAETKKAYRDGWFHTADLARVDERGFIYIEGRKKDMIITGGENVFPAEVENVLYKHPAVAQSAVIGVPDERWGESITAVVVKKAHAQVTADDIRVFCRNEIAGYKVPKKVVFVDTLPMSASGKLLKGKLKEQIAF